MTSRTIAAMPDRTSRLDLALLAVTIVGLSRLTEPPTVWAIALLLLVALPFGTLQVLSDEVPASAADEGVPIESLILPSVAAVGCLGAIRLVPFGLWLVPALLLTGILVVRALAIEARILSSSPDGLSVSDRTSLLVTMLLIAFLAFTGVAAMVPGGLVQATREGGTTPPLSETYLIVLAAGDALIAFLLGYRAAALRVSSLRAALFSALTYAVAIAIAAAALRALAMPRLLGPALLTLAFYLWDTFHGASPARRRDIDWVWQTVLLAGLGILVVAWNLLLRG